MSGRSAASEISIASCKNCKITGIQNTQVQSNSSYMFVVVVML